MKIIKFKLKEKFKYKRKVIIKNLVLNIFIGIHNFEKKKKQRVRFNIDITTDSNIKPNNNNLASIVNYEDAINKITYITEKKHHELLEDLAENIFDIIFEIFLIFGFLSIFDTFFHIGTYIYYFLTFLSIF